MHVVPQNDQDNDYFSDEFETLLGTNVEEAGGYEDWLKFEKHVYSKLNMDQNYMKFHDFAFSKTVAFGITKEDTDNDGQEDRNSNREDTQEDGPHGVNGGKA